MKPEKKYIIVAIGPVISSWCCGVPQCGVQQKLSPFKRKLDFLTLIYFVSVNFFILPLHCSLFGEASFRTPVSHQQWVNVLEYQFIILRQVFFMHHSYHRSEICWPLSDLKMVFGYCFFHFFYKALTWMRRYKEETKHCVTVCKSGIIYRKCTYCNTVQMAYCNIITWIIICKELPK